jgi:hypothetical protein
MFASLEERTLGRPRRRRVPPELAARARPVATAASRLLAVPAPLAPLFVDGGLRRGSTTLVAAAPGMGATTLSVSLLAAASSGGCWCAAIGLTDPGVVAMAELGIDLRRVVFVPRPKGGWADAAGELLDGVDVVLVHPPGRVRLHAARHLAARARERRAALVVLVDRPEQWPVGPDLALRVISAEWFGPESGDGHLRGRRVEVQVSGRGPAGSGAVHRLWLPSASGAVAEVGPTG